MAPRWRRATACIAVASLGSVTLPAQSAPGDALLSALPAARTGSAFALPAVGGEVPRLDLQALATKMKGKFPADTELLDKLLTAKGTFKVRLVVGELDLRHADASRFSVGRVAVKVPGETSSHRGAYRVNGTAVTGTLTF